MISLIQPLGIGNALRLLISPDPRARVWRVLRKEEPAFSGHDDPGAVVAHEGSETVFVDDFFLVNGTQYFYRIFYLVGATWIDSGRSVSGAPQATYQELTWDAMSVLRDRLDYGLQAEVARGELVPASGHIAVLTAPPLFENTAWPVVTVQVLNDGPVERAIGEQLMADINLGDTGVDAYEGWLARAQIAVLASSLNPDERVALRKALRRVVIGNLPVFEAHGMTQVELQTQDMEDFQSYNVPVYQVMATFSCTVPVAVSDRAGRVREVITSLIRE